MFTHYEEGRHEDENDQSTGNEGEDHEEKNDESKNTNENTAKEEEPSQNVTKKRQRQRTDTTSTSSFENAPKARFLPYFAFNKVKNLSKIQRQKSTSYEESTSQVEYIDDQSAEETTEEQLKILQIEAAKKKIDRTLNSQNDSADASTSTASSSSNSNLEFTLGNDSNDKEKVQKLNF